MGLGEDEDLVEFIKNVDAASEGIKPSSNATVDPLPSIPCSSASPSSSPSSPALLAVEAFHQHHSTIRDPAGYDLDKSEADTGIRISGWESGPFGPL